MLRVAVNLFWFAYLADGVFYLLIEAALAMGAPPVLRDVRTPLGLLVVFASVAMAGVVVLTPRAPGRVLVPLILITWWASFTMGFPLVFLKIPHLTDWLSFLQVVSAMAVWLLFRGPGSRWTEPFALNDRPAFAWRHAMIAAPLVLAVAFATAVVGVVGGVAGQIETMSGGYVRLRPDGLYIVERQFRSGDREVCLTGMMHIGGEEFYSSILPRGDQGVPSIVLVEGVTDHKGLLGDDALQYTRLARLLNTDSQMESSFTQRVRAGLRHGGHGPDAAGSEIGEDDGIWFKHADVDVATFHPRTIAFILAVMSLMQAESWQQAVQMMTQPGSPINDKEAQRYVTKDVLEARNAQLVEEIEVSLKDYRRVIVPWGAMHLPGIESWLRGRQFEQSGEIERKALSFW